MKPSKILETPSLENPGSPQLQPAPDNEPQHSRAPTSFRARFMSRPCATSPRSPILETTETPYPCHRVGAGHGLGRPGRPQNGSFCSGEARESHWIPVSKRGNQGTNQPTNSTLGSKGTNQPTNLSCPGVRTYQPCPAAQARTAKCPARPKTPSKNQKRAWPRSATTWH